MATEEKLVTGVFSAAYVVVSDDQLEHYVVELAAFTSVTLVGPRGGIPPSVRRLGVAVTRLPPFSDKDVEQFVAEAPVVASSLGYPLPGFAVAASIADGTMAPVAGATSIPIAKPSIVNVLGNRLVWMVAQAARPYTPAAEVGVDKPDEEDRAL